MPFGAAAYFERRLRYALPLGLTGYTARVSRSGDKIFGTPSEVNLLALARILDDPTLPAEAVTAEFVQRRYGVDPASAEGQWLAQAIELSFDVGRKMYYFLGFWALEKSSGLPDTLRRTELLVGRSIAKYDQDYDDVFAALAQPTAQTLVDLRQEKTEALALVRTVRDYVEHAAPALSAEDAADLRYRFRHQELCTAVWREVAEVVWAYKLRRQGGGNATEAAAWIDAGLAALEALAATIDAELPADRQYPCPADEVRALAADLRTDFPPAGGAARAQLVISPPDITVTARDGATVDVHLAFATDAAVQLRLQYGTKLPDYNDGGLVEPESPGPATLHSFRLAGLPADRWYVVRAVAPGAGPVAAGGPTDLVGSDWWVATRPTFVRRGVGAGNATVSSWP